MVLYIVVWYIQESGTINVVKKMWLYGPCSSCTSPLINFGTAPFVLANGIWIMSTPRWCICVCSHDCWCRILPLHWTPLRYAFWVQGSSFPKRCWNCQNMHLFLPVVNTCAIWTSYDCICRSLFMTDNVVFCGRPHYLLNCLVDFWRLTKNVFCFQTVLPTYVPVLGQPLFVL
jgi:hypothetical protein